jgi:LPXTG-motif cell wall-anchored protein
VNVDKDSATATVNRDTDSTTTYKSETTIAQNDTNKNLRNDDSTYQTRTDRDQLPKTASSLPEIGALGLLALIGAAVVAFARKV